MYVKELWRYPVKSMAGERVLETELTLLGFPNDRKVLVAGPSGRVITSRTHHRLLGLKGTLGEDGEPLVSGHRWNSLNRRRAPARNSYFMKVSSASMFYLF